MKREEEIQAAAEKIYPYKGGTKGAICSASIPIFIQGAKWADKTTIEKACNWLAQNADAYTWYNEIEGESGMSDEFIKDFKKAMEGE